MTSYAKDVLVETDWLAEHAKDPNVRTFEVDVDTSAYEQGHVAGAIGLNWRSDLQQHPVRDLIEKKQLEELLSKNGVTPTTTIVIYGDNNNWFAAWFFWLLKYYGHKDVKLVNGGRAKWIAEKRPLASDTPSYTKSEYRAGTPDASIRALRDHVLEKVVSGNGTKIVDVRSPKEYAGELLAPENLPQEGRSEAGTFRARRTSPGRPRSPKTAASNRPTS
jgi:thiosulfate/3-mercaptopyruvate sulfurtransferase